MSYRTTFEAEEDISEIFAAGIADYGIARAEAYLADEPPVRLRIIKAHVVVYREENGGALIIRVLNGRQDISRELN